VLNVTTNMMNASTPAVTLPVELPPIFTLIVTTMFWFGVVD